MQFKSAYKKLSVKHQISSFKSILFVASGHRAKTSNDIIEEEEEIHFSEMDHDYFLQIVDIAPYAEDVVSYISVL